MSRASKFWPQPPQKFHKTTGKQSINLFANFIYSKWSVACPQSKMPPHQTLKLLNKYKYYHKKKTKKKINKKNSNPFSKNNIYIYILKISTYDVHFL